VRGGFLVAGIILVIIGLGSLFAVAASAAHCPVGYTCTIDPVGFSLGIILLVFGFIMLILAFVLKK